MSDTNPSNVVQLPTAIPPPPSGLLPPGPRLIAALAAVQGEIRSINKDREVDAISKSGKSYKFKYATLAEIWEAIRASCAKNGLAIAQPATVDANRKVVSVKTLLMHVSGECIESVTELPIGDFTPQGIGSLISYARRYGLSSLLGVTSADDDDDAATSNPHDRREPPPTSQRTPPPPSPQRAPATQQTATPPPQTNAHAVVEPKKPEPTGARFEELRQWMEQCKSVEELGRVAQKVTEAKLAKEVNAEERRVLLSTYKTKTAELKAPPALPGVSE